jgi:hypothetical protein
LIVGRERRMGTDCMMGKRIHKCIRYMYVLFFKKSYKKTTFSKPTEKLQKRAKMKNRTVNKKLDRISGVNNDRI